ncbi:MAG: VCBS repeat-containing protein [Terriglobales bacterium]
MITGLYDTVPLVSFIAVKRSLVSRHSGVFMVLVCAFCVGLVGCGSGTNRSGSQTPPPSQGVSYATPVTFSSAGTDAGSLAIADFNGDGKLDIAVSNFSSNTIAVFLNQGSGTFAAPIINSIQIPDGLGPMALGDFNEDGKPDLIDGTVSGPQVDLVLLGVGDGTFIQSGSIPNSFGFLHGRVADLNGDKHLDFVGCSNGNMHVALGNGDGTFQPVVYLPPGPLPNTYLGCDLGDFNGDKKLDILGADLSGNLVLFAGNGDGTFQPPVAMSSVSSEPESVSAADFSGDGNMDVLVGFNAGTALLFSGNGNGSFGNTFDVYTDLGGDGVTVLAADVNNDGEPDALVIDYTHGIFTILLNTGTGISSQSKSYTFILKPGLADIAVGDLNGDGLPDIVITNALTNELTIFLSQK